MLGGREATGRGCRVLAAVSSACSSDAQLHKPLDFSSCVHMCMSSWISSGATSLRVHDCSQCGLGGAVGWSSAWPAFAARDPSLEPKTFLKKGILEVNSQSRRGCLAACAVSGAEELQCWYASGMRSLSALGGAAGVRCAVWIDRGRGVSEPSSAAGCRVKLRLVGRDVCVCV